MWDNLDLQTKYDVYSTYRSNFENIPYNDIKNDFDTYLSQIAQAEFLPTSPQNTASTGRNFNIPFTNTQEPITPTKTVNNNVAYDRHFDFSKVKDQNYTDYTYKPYEEATKQKYRQKQSPQSGKTATPKMDKGTWIGEITQAYKRAGISDENAIKMLVAQDAHESGWGRSAQGAYNYGNITTGSAWKGGYVKGNDKDAVGNPITQKFRAYSDMDGYAADKIRLLKNTYEFDESDNIDTFAKKLKGLNKKKYQYAEDPNYEKALKSVYYGLLK